MQAVPYKNLSQCMDQTACVSGGGGSQESEDGGGGKEGEGEEGGGSGSHSRCVCSKF